MITQQIVLVVDDSSVDRAICQRFLQRDKRHNYTFWVAPCGEVALEICQHSMPDIILLDYKLPDMDGVDLLRRLQSLVFTRYLGIVMLTAQGDETVAVRAMKAGVQDYLPKGKLTAGALCRAVHNVLEQQKLQKQLDWQQEQQQLISTIALRIHQSLDLQVVLDSTVAEVRQFLQADHVMICQVQPDGNSIIRAESVETGRIRILEDPIVDPYFPVASIEQYLPGHYWGADALYQVGLTPRQLQFLEQLEVQANLVVPILLTGEVSTYEQNDDASTPPVRLETTPSVPQTPSSTPRLWGLLIAHQCNSVHCWQKEERQLLDQLATHLAIAIHQAELYQQTKELAEQQRITAILRQERNFISAILDVEGALVVVLDCEGRIVSFNQACQITTGYSLTEVAGKVFWDFLLLPEEVEAVKTVYRSLRQGNLPSQYENYWVAKDGSHRLIAWSNTVLLDDTGAVEYLIGTGIDITERKQTERALRESEAMNRAIRNALPDLTIRMTRGGTLLDFIPAKTFSIIQPYQNMQGRNIFDVLPPNLAQERLYYAELALATGETQIYEYQIAIDGHSFWQEARLVKSGADEVLVVVRSIHDRKLAEQALAASEARLRAVVQHSFDIIVILNADGSRRFINDSVERILGYSPVTMIGRGAFEGIHPADLKQVQSALQSALEQPEQPICVDFRYQHQDGHWVDLELVGTNLLHQPEIQGIVANLRDVSARKRTENDLRESERHYATLADALPVGISRKDADGNCTYVNDHWSEITGLTFQEGLGQGWLDCVHPDYRDRIFAWWTTVTQHNLSISDQHSLQFWQEICLQRRDGSVKWVYCQIVPEIDDSGNVTGYVGSITDITQQKQTETALEGFNRELEARVEQRTTELRQTVVWLEQEVQERKQAELELRHNRALREAIFNESADAIFLVDSESLLTIDCNNRAVELFAASHREELIGIAIHTLQRRQLNETELRAIANEMTVTGCWNAEIEYVTRQGKLFWGNLATRVMQFTGNKMHLVRVSDISERKQTEFAQRQQIERELLLASITQRLRESLDLPTVLNTMVIETQRLLQADRVLVYRITADGSGKAIAEKVIPGWRSILNQVFPSEAFPSNCYRCYIQGHVCVLPDREQSHVLPCLVDFMRTFQIRAKLVAPIIQGTTLWGLLIAHQCAAPRNWQEWEVNLLRQLGNQLAIAIQQSELYQQLQLELDERKQAEIQLQQTNMQLSIANGELARATRHKDEFLANMSHELRTPLNAVLGMSEALLEETCGSLSDRQRKAVLTIEKSGKHLLDLINDILDLAKIEAGKLELHFSQTVIKTLCSSSLTFVKQMAVKKKIQLIANIPPGIGNIEADDRRIQQVLINLLSNAVKFTPENGSVMLDVWSTDVSEIQTLSNGVPASTQVPRPTTYINFSVSDTGIGIAPDHRDKIFQPFVQIDSSLSRQFSGTGLGLALVRRIVSMHHGTITLDSQVGQGSRFTVHLPQQQLSERHPPAIETAVTLPLPEIAPVTPYGVGEIVSNQPTLRILLVEDNEANIETIAEYLTFEGYELVFAMDGEAAIAKAKTEHPDVILMDIQMPGIDGFEAMRIIRADSAMANIPIIAVTALAMASDRAQCLTAGANVYLTKPVSLKQLVKQIQQLTASQ